MRAIRPALLFVCVGVAIAAHAHAQPVTGAARSTPKCIAPMIQGEMTFAGNATDTVRPERDIRVWGCGFGTGGGVLSIVGSGLPGGRVDASPTMWSDDVVHAKVPEVRGVFQQT